MQSSQVRSPDIQLVVVMAGRTGEASVPKPVHSACLLSCVLVGFLLELADYPEGTSLGV